MTDEFTIDDPFEVAVDDTDVDNDVVAVDEPEVATRRRRRKLSPEVMTTIKIMTAKPSTVEILRRVFGVHAEEDDYVSLIANVLRSANDVKTVIAWILEETEKETMQIAFDVSTLYDSDPSWYKLTLQLASVIGNMKPPRRNELGKLMLTCAKWIDGLKQGEKNQLKDILEVLE